MQGRGRRDHTNRYKYDCWVGVIVHNVFLRGRAFRLNSSPALLLQLQFASLLPAPGIVIRDDCGLSVEGAWTYALAWSPCRGSGSST
jgi:hypothetical protein